MIQYKSSQEKSPSSPIGQETVDLKSTKCGFESHLGDHILGSSQAVRHWILTPRYASSNLAYPTIYGGMLELADKLHLECSAVRRDGAEPSTATIMVGSSNG